MKIKDFLHKDEEQLLIDSIKKAELNTSGEIRVHIESKCGENVFDRAIYILNYLKMYKTAQRNVVLFYIAADSRKFAIIGEEGINNVVPDNFWDNIKQEMITYFAKGEYIKGMCVGIEEVGHSLKEYFPYQDDDINEQPDEISYGI